jgi:hypothetical protein
MRIVHRLLLANILCLLSTSLVAGQVRYERIAVSGEAAPGADDTFLRFSNPLINASGDVAFQANLSGPTTDVVPHGVWTTSQGVMTAVAVAGVEAPGTGGARFRTPGWPIVLTDEGKTLFYGHLVNGPGVTFDNDYGIWAGSPGDIRLLARKSDPAPGVPPDVNYSLFFANPHSSGLMGFSASLSGDGVDELNGSAAWVGPVDDPAGLEVVARGGDLAAGLDDGARFSSVGTPAVNADGQFALFATATMEGTPTAHSAGIWAATADELHLVAVAAAPAPGAPGRFFDFFSGPRLNNAGQILFAASLTADSDEEYLSDAGIWAGPASSAEIDAVVREGWQASGFETGVIFRGSAPGDEVTYDPFGVPVLGGGGHVAFRATIFGDGVDFDHNDGVWISTPLNSGGEAELMLLAREGDHPPGTPDGTHFHGIFSGDDLLPAFENPSLNASGQIAFEALTTGPLGEFGRGIWVTDRLGRLHLVAHTGDDFLVAPGDVRQIALVKLHSGGSSEEGILAPLNDAGRLAFAVSFTDGTEAVFVATIVPEPCTAALFLVAMALVRFVIPQRGSRRRAAV